MNLGRMHLGFSFIYLFISRANVFDVNVQLFSLSLLFKSLSLVRRVQLVTFYAFNLNVWLCCLQKQKIQKENKRKENWKRHDRMYCVHNRAIASILPLLLLTAAHHERGENNIRTQNHTHTQTPALAPASNAANENHKLIRITMCKRFVCVNE